MKSQYQISKIDLIDADRNKRGLDNKWSGKIIVSVIPIDVEGNFNYEPLKLRGYSFGGKNVGVIGRKWVKPFNSEAEAEAEVDCLCEGI